MKKTPRITKSIRKQVISEMMREIAHRRKPGDFKGGRPRSDAPRCPCGLMTLKLAKIRCHKCGAANTEALSKV